MKKAQKKKHIISKIIEDMNSDDSAGDFEPKQRKARRTTDSAILSVSDSTINSEHKKPKARMIQRSSNIKSKIRRPAVKDLSNESDSTIDSKPMKLKARRTSVKKRRETTTPNNKGKQTKRRKSNIQNKQSSSKSSPKEKDTNP